MEKQSGDVLPERLSAIHNMGIGKLAKTAIMGALGGGAMAGIAIAKRIKKQQDRLPLPNMKSQSAEAMKAGLSGSTVFSRASDKARGMAGSATAPGLARPMTQPGQPGPDPRATGPQPTMQQRPSQAQQATPGTPSCRKTIRGVKPRFNR